MKNKTCMICKLGVKIPGDKYVIVREQDENDETKSKGYYHRTCFSERLNGNSSLQKLQAEAFDFIRGAKNKLGLETEKEIKILEWQV